MLMWPNYCENFKRLKKKLIGEIQEIEERDWHLRRKSIISKAEGEFQKKRFEVSNIQERRKFSKMEEFEWWIS